MNKPFFYQNEAHKINLKCEKTKFTCNRVYGLLRKCSHLNYVQSFNRITTSINLQSITGSVYLLSKFHKPKSRKQQKVLEYAFRELQINANEALKKLISHENFDWEILNWCQHIKRDP